MSADREYDPQSDPQSDLSVPDSSEPEEKSGSTALRVITWFSVGIAVAAVGIYVGAELRNRYRFKKRTPYDFYSNAGSQQASEFGVGV
jgi:cytochrome oxidase assembly protein ShyY1